MVVSPVERMIGWLKKISARGSLVQHATKKELLQMMGKVLYFSNFPHKKEGNN